jgi:hypothetical protein
MGNIDALVNIGYHIDIKTSPSAPLYPQSIITDFSPRPKSVSEIGGDLYGWRRYNGPGRC